MQSAFKRPPPCSDHEAERIKPCLNGMLSRQRTGLLYTRCSTCFRLLHQHASSPEMAGSIASTLWQKSDCLQPVNLHHAGSSIADDVKAVMSGQNKAHDSQQIHNEHHSFPWQQQWQQQKCSANNDLAINVSLVRLQRHSAYYSSSFCIAACNHSC